MGDNTENCAEKKTARFHQANHQEIGKPKHISLFFWCLVLGAWCLVLGAWMTFFYSISEGIFPEASSAVNVLGIILLTLCFSLTSMVGVFYGSFSTLWLVCLIGWLMRFWSKRKARLHYHFDNLWLIVGSILLFALFSASIWEMSAKASLSSVHLLFLYFFALVS